MNAASANARLGIGGGQNTHRSGTLVVRQWGGHRR